MVKQWEPRENSYIFEKSKSRENENYQAKQKYMCVYGHMSKKSRVGRH